MMNLMITKSLVFQIDPKEKGPQLDPKTGKYRPARKRIWINLHGERVENKNLHTQNKEK